MKSYINLWKPFIALLAIFVAIAACTGSNSAIPSTSPNDVATIVAATMEAIQAQATPTSITADRIANSSSCFADRPASSADPGPACRDPHQFPR